MTKNIPQITESKDEMETYLANHYIHSSNWLRAAVLDANDGLLTIANLSGRCSCRK